MIQFTNAVDRYSKLVLTSLKDAGVVCWIAGGAVRDYFMGVNTSTDYDLFFPNLEQYEKARSYFLANSGTVIWESDNGLKLSHDRTTYDLVKKFFATPKETIDAFDFTVSMFAVDTENVYHGETSFIDLAKRQLMVNKITYPSSTMSRAFRYYKKGFTMCLGEQKKLVEAIQAMPKVEPVSKPKTESTQVADDIELPSGNTIGDFFLGID